jgi:hypothetical protein
MPADSNTRNTGIYINWAYPVSSIKTPGSLDICGFAYVFAETANIVNVQSDLL